MNAKSTVNFRIYESLIKTITEMISSSSKPLILVIDGMCGSGKTTLAEYLCEVFDASVIHMDNFFLPLDRKTPARLSEAGGNIDYERFSQIVIPALKKRTSFSYIAYNCQTTSYDREIHIPSCDLFIVEGSYSLHQNFGKYYDLSLFLTVSPKEQLQRLEDRCQNRIKFHRFKSEWIPMEQRYHDVQEVLSRCDMIIDTSVYY